MRILGIDLGTKRVGLAIADLELRIATGLDVIEYKNREYFLGRLKEVIDSEEIDMVVIGLPVNMDGSEGPKAKSARVIAEIISERFRIKHQLVDERLTTVQAIRELHAGDGKVGKSRDKINMMSAIFILQNYLDSLPPNINDD